MSQNWEIKTWRINLTNQIRKEEQYKNYYKEDDRCGKEDPTVKKKLLCLKKIAGKWNKK